MFIGTTQKYKSNKLVFPNISLTFELEIMILDTELEDRAESWWYHSLNNEQWKKALE